MSKIKIFSILLIGFLFSPCVVSSYAPNISYDEIIVSSCNSCIQLKDHEVNNCLLYEEEIYYYQSMSGCIYHPDSLEWYEWAIRLTPTELEKYSGWSLNAARFFHCADTTISIMLNIYSEGTPTYPGSVIAQVFDTASGIGMIRVDLDPPIQLEITREYWVSFVIYNPTPGEPLIGVDDGPAVDGKGDWHRHNLKDWSELQYQPGNPIDANLFIQAIVSAPMVTPFVTTKNATDIEDTSATLNGRLESLGNDVSCEVWFEYGLTTSYESSTFHRTMLEISNFHEDISGLTKGNKYHFRAVAKNSMGTVYGEDKSFTAITENHPPETPTISGSESGETGSSYVYTANSSDPDGDTLEFWFDWGDGNNTGWQSGSSASHTWDLEGDYTIKVKARDEHGYESDWGTLEVTMPKNKMNNLLARLLHYISFISIWGDKV
jgi:hypothetical protein